MISRRKALRQLANVPLLGGAIGYLISGHEFPADRSKPSFPAGDYHDYIHELGLRTFINAKGTYTSLSGCPTFPGLLRR